MADLRKHKMKVEELLVATIYKNRKT